MYYTVLIVFIHTGRSLDAKCSLIVLFAFYWEQIGGVLGIGNTLSADFNDCVALRLFPKYSYWQTANRCSKFSQLCHQRSQRWLSLNPTVFSFALDTTSVQRVTALEHIQKSKPNLSRTGIPPFLSSRLHSNLKQSHDHTSSSSPILSESQDTYSPSHYLDDPKRLLQNASDRSPERVRDLMNKLTAQLYFGKGEFAEAGKHRERHESLRSSEDSVVFVMRSDPPLPIDDVHTESNAETSHFQPQLLDNQERSLDVVEPPPMLPIHGNFIGGLRADFTAPRAPAQPAAIAQLAPVHQANVAAEPQLEALPALGLVAYPPIGALPLPTPVPFILPQIIALHERGVAIPSRRLMNPTEELLNDEDDEPDNNNNIAAPEEEDAQHGDAFLAVPLPIGGPDLLHIRLPAPINLHPYPHIAAALPDRPNYGIGHPSLLMQPAPAPPQPPPSPLRRRWTL